MREAITIVLLAATLATAGCRTAPVRNVPRTAVVAPGATMAQLSEAIWAAGRREGWRVREVSPGVMHAEKSQRRHRALVRIDYDPAGFAVTLLEADDLLYDGHRIHKAYNRWVEELERSIEEELHFRFR